MRVLIDKGTDANSANNNALISLLMVVHDVFIKTPLLYAVIMANLEIVRRIEQQDVSTLYHTNKYGRTTVTKACRRLIP